ncbi:MAG TPA: NADH-quinone oxidoreductase subunit J [Bacteroidota bacterium]|nr:NADH-quinone oxidoreductase subunit J [Bacteroidota bacterium]
MSILTDLTTTDIVFYVFAVVVILSAAVVVFSKNIIHSAFSLMFTFFGVAGLYVLLNADFIAVTQVLVYVGGILVLLLFGVMLTTRVVDIDTKAGTLHAIPASILAALLVGTLCGVFWITDWVTPAPKSAAPASTASTIGQMLMTTYLLPFEVASVVLLVAMIGAAMIARREKKRT